jgi:hypothetical protein
MTDIHIDLDEYQAIMEGLPAPAKGERRQHSLTRDDILVIAKIVKATSHQTCGKCERRKSCLTISDA